jgi:FkbM family methyltransferase
MSDPWPQRQSSEQATLDDLYYCYRVLLKREPDDEGWNFWSKKIADEDFTVTKLAAYFCQSHEYLTNARARGLKLVTLEDFELYVYEHDWDVGAQMLEKKQYEPDVTAFLKDRLQPGFTFVDVGANVGYFTILAAKLLGRTGRTIAIECNSRNCELIYLNLHHNSIENALVYQFAVSDAQKLLSLTAGFSNGEVDELRDDQDALIVPAVTLDFLLQNEPRIDIIKMDIEGSEAKAWRGMQQTIRKHHPTIVMELFPALLERHSRTSTTDFLDQIFSAGYFATILRTSDMDNEQITDDSDHGSEKASNSLEVMEILQQRKEFARDESQAYLNLALELPRQPRRKLFSRLSRFWLRSRVETV